MPEKDHRTATIAQWFIAVTMAFMAIALGLEADWNRAASLGAISVAHILLATGWTERDTRAKVLTWAALAISLGLFVARRGFGIGAPSA